MRSGSQFPAGDELVTGLGEIEYRLARDSIVREFRRGRLSRLDICDAQPELIRVATNLGAKTEIDCPICEVAKLVHVSFAFGPRMPPGGRVVANSSEFASLSRNGADVAFYMVEVCTACSWNHLLRMFTGDTARRRRRL